MSCKIQTRRDCDTVDESTKGQDNNNEPADLANDQPTSSVLSIALALVQFSEITRRNTRSTASRSNPGKPGKRHGSRKRARADSKQANAQYVDSSDHDIEHKDPTNQELLQEIRNRLEFM